MAVAPAAAPAAPAAAPTITPGTPPTANGGAGGVIADAPKAATSAPVPEAFKPYKFKAKVAGKEIEREYTTQHELDDVLNRGEASGAAFREAAEARKAVAKDRALVDDFIKAMDDDPLSGLSELARAKGISEKSLREKLKKAMAEREEYEKIPEEQRQFYEQHQEQARKLKALETEKQTAEEKAKEAAFQRQVAENDQRFMQEHEAVLAEMPEYTSEFAKERVLPLIADVHRIAGEGKYKLHPKVAAKETRKMIGTFVEGHLKQMPVEHFGKVVGARLGTMEPEAIGAMLGPEKMRAIGRWMVDNARKQQGAAPQQQTNGAQSRPQTSASETSRAATENRLNRRTLRGQDRARGSPSGGPFRFSRRVPFRDLLVPKWDCHLTTVARVAYRPPVRPYANRSEDADSGAAPTPKGERGQPVAQAGKSRRRTT